MRDAIIKLTAADGKPRPKIAEEIALRAKRTERIVARWIAGTDSPNGEALANLIRSDIGDAVIAGLTRDVTHQWARDQKRTREMSKLRRQQSDIARQLAKLEGGE